MCDSPSPEPSEPPTDSQAAAHPPPDAEPLTADELAEAKQYGRYGYRKAGELLDAKKGGGREEAFVEGGPGWSPHLVLRVHVAHPHRFPDDIGRPGVRSAEHVADVLVGLLCLAGHVPNAHG